MIAMAIFRIQRRGTITLKASLSLSYSRIKHAISFPLQCPHLFALHVVSLCFPFNSVLCIQVTFWLPFCDSMKTPWRVDFAAGVASSHIVQAHIRILLLILVKIFLSSCFSFNFSHTSITFQNFKHTQDNNSQSFSTTSGTLSALF